MPWKGLLEPFIKSYEQILNFRIRNFSSYFQQEKLLEKFIDGKGVSVSVQQKCSD